MRWSAACNWIFLLALFTSGGKQLEAQVTQPGGSVDQVDQVDRTMEDPDGPRTSRGPDSSAPRGVENGSSTESVPEILAPASRGENAAPPLRFRRVLVPEDRIAEMARGHMPLERSVLAKHLATIRGTAGRSEGAAGARLTEAQYYGRWEAGRIVAGSAQLSVLLSSEGPSLVSLSPCGLAIGNRPAAEMATAFSRLGVAADGGLWAYVQSAGELEFSWTLQSRPRNDGWGVPLVIPPTPSNRLWLDVPVGFRLTSNRGIVTNLQKIATPGEKANADRFQMDKALGNATPPAGHERWLLELGGQHRVELKIEPVDPAVSGPPLQVRQRTTYEIKGASVETMGEIRLDVERPRRQFTILSDLTLQVKSIDFRGAQADWSATVDDSGGRQRIVVELSEPIVGRDLAFRIFALSPLTLQRPQRLPTFRVVGAIWREGDLKLRIADSLGVTLLAANGCSELPAESTLDGGELSERSFQAFDPTAALVVHAGVRSNRVRMRSGTTLQFDPAEVRSTFRAKLRGEVGETFDLAADVPAGWTVEQVEVEPPEALVAYRIVRGGRAGRNSRRLAIGLNEAIRADREVGLKIVSSRRVVATQPLTVVDFRPWRFSNVVVDKAFVAVESSNGYRLRPRNDLELKRVAIDALPEADRNELFAAEAAPQMTFMDDAAVDSLSVGRVRVQPEFDVSIAMETMLEPEALTELYRIECRPESGAIRQLAVFLSIARETAVQWSIEQAGDVSIERVSRRDSDPDMQIGGEIWNLELNRSLIEPFVLVGRRQSPTNGPAQVALAALHAAASQTGQVEVTSGTGAAVRISQSQLTVLSNDALPWNDPAVSRVRLRYEPSRGGELQIDLDSRNDGRGRLWAWNGRLTSHVLEHGESWHRAAWNLENQDAKAAVVGVPPGVSVTACVVDGNPVALGTALDEGRNLRISLPRGVRFPTVVVEYRSQNLRLGLAQRLEIPVLEPEFVVLDGRSEVWLPAPFSVLSLAELMRWPDAREPGVRKRLFGPLAASSSRGSSPTNWIARADEMEERDAAVTQAFDRALQSVATAVATESPSWGEFFAEAANQLTSWQIPLVVDDVALRRIGLGPNILLSSATTTPGDLTSSELLRRAGLQLVETRGRLVITSVREAALRVLPRRLDGHPLQAVRVGDGVAVGDADVVGRRGDLFVDAETWGALPGPEASIWLSVSDLEAKRLAESGWTAHEVDLSEDVGLTVATPWIYRRDALRVSGWLAVLVTAGFLSWACRSRPNSVLVPLGLAGIVAILAPPALTPLTSGIFLGAIGAGCGVLLWGRAGWASNDAPVEPSGDSVVNGLPRVVGLLLMVTLTVSAARLTAQMPEAPPRASTTADPVYRVLVPVNEDREPSDDHDFLPLPFYEALLRSSAAASSAPKGWLIEAADYAGSINLEAVDDAPPLGELTATIRLRTFDADQRVRLPLGRRQLELVASSLDGVRVQLEWGPGNASLDIPIALPGEHRLQLTLRPLVREVDGDKQFEAVIPRLASTSLELRVFGSPRRVSVPGAVGDVVYDEEGRRVLAELGPTDRLRLEWSDEEEPTAAPMEITSEELLWLKVKPQAVVVDGLFRITARSGTIEDVTLSLDPRLRLLRVDPPLDGRPSVKMGERQLLQLRFAGLLRRELTFRASFLLDGSSGVGSLAPPDLTVESARATRRWLAVSVAEPLSMEPNQDNDNGAVPIEDFVESWGGDAGKPDLVMDRQLLTRRWAVSTHFRDAPTTVEHRTWLSVGERSARYLHEATLANESGLEFQYQLGVPKDLIVDKLVLVDENGERPVEALPTSPRKLSVVLGQRGARRAKLVVEGRLPVRGRRLDLPQIQVDGTQALTADFRVYRRPSARLNWKGVKGLNVDDTAKIGQYEAGWGRLDAVLRQEQAESGLAKAAGWLQVEANKTRVEGRLLAEMRRLGGNWEAEIDYRIRVRSGVVDAVRLEIPIEWSEPFSVDQELQYEVQNLPGSQRRHLVVYPPKAVDREFRFQVRGALDGYPNESDGIPDFVPLDVDQDERIIVVPTRFDQNVVEWVPSGLQAVALPPELGDLAPDEYAAFRVVGSRPRATIRQVKSSVDEPQIRLADIHIRWQANGDCDGVAVFDLEPAGQSHVVLRVPSEYALIATRVAGRPAYLESSGEGQWRVQLGPDLLPQRVEVLFRGRLSPPNLDASNWRVSAPRLEDVPVERTVWTLVPDSGSRRYGLLDDFPPATPLRQETLRTNSISAVIDNASPLLSDQAQQEIDRWYGVWGPRLVASRNRWRREAILSDQVKEADRERLVELDRQQSDVAQRLKTTTLLEEWRTVPPRTAEAADAWRTESDVRDDVIRCAVIGSSDYLELAVQFPPNAPSAKSIAVAVAIGVLTLLVGWAVSRRWLQVGVAQWPHAWGVLLGIAWWLFLWPGFVGWLLVAVSLVGVFRRPWRAVHQSAPVSTVIRRDVNSRG